MRARIFSLVILFSVSSACTEAPTQPTNPIDGTDSGTQVFDDAQVMLPDLTVDSDSGMSPPDAGEIIIDGGTMAMDGGTSPSDSGEMAMDGGASPSDSGEMAFDSGSSPWDSGGGGLDASWPSIDGSLPGLDGSLPSVDGGLPGWDGSLPVFDTGIGQFDATAPSFDGSIPAFPDAGAGQTTVTLAAIDPVQIWFNLMPIVAPDPLRAEIKLDFNNTGSTNELLSIVSVNVIISPLPPPPPAVPRTFLQQFTMQPDYSAPPGMTTKSFTKVLGTGIPATVSQPQDLCNELAYITIELSNQVFLLGQATTSCVF